MTIRAVKVCDAGGFCDISDTIAGVNFVTAEHNSSVNRAVANMSLQFPATQALDDAVRGSLNAGVTYACGTGFNDNNACTHQKRIDVSRAFWAAAFPSLVVNGGSQLTNNAEFVHRCYEVYLRRSVPDTDGGFQFWLNHLNSFGNPANQNGINALIDAFTSSIEYQQRFGPA